MRAFVTVGSTQFDCLVQASLSVAVLTALRGRGYLSLVVQCGKFARAGETDGGLDKWTMEKGGMSIEMWRYKPTLAADYDNADLIISHAGSGTILDVLRLGKPLIVLPNPTLADNHQEELAAALDHLGHLKSTTISNLANCIDSFQPSSLKPFPLQDPKKFSDIIDEEMGFIPIANK
ncbi:glycosyl transferase [Rickenella mellea]|uniref:UDP-N-acetylglucosamine transferase subunit ALG13 n=1 Tax=Rickenella mellea TaxID=50990 RepID=A0A4Y7QJJ4_9AGAM|nr:glycosyl transferase [Rickenella mellea]